MCSNIEAREGVEDGKDDTMRRHRFIVAVAMVSVFLAHAGSPVHAQEQTARDDLGEVTSRLVPYDLGGDTLGALGELEELGMSLEPRTAATARFLRAAAAVDLLVYARLVGSSTLPAELAAALHTTPDEMVRHIDSELGAARGSFTIEASSCQIVLSCVSGQELERCGSQLREVADSGRAGATAARLLLFERLAQVGEQARSGSAARAAELLLELGRRVCAGSGSPAFAQHCSAAEAEQDVQLREAALVRAVTYHATGDLQALRRNAEGGDPMARLASSWLEGAVERLGWSIVTRPFSASSLSDLTLPPSACAITLPPLELMVISRAGVHVALAPAMVASAAGPFQLDERVGASLPGRQVVQLPARFRAVIRPIPQLTAALNELRENVSGTLRPLGENGPTWLASEQPVLGLLVDTGVTMIDLARYVASARQAGYERFALLGLREDGQLGLIPTEFGTLRAGPEPADLPRLRIGPREVGFTVGQANMGTVPSEDFAELAPTLVNHLSSGRRSMAAQGRLALSYGVLFAPIDSLVSSNSSGTPPVLVLLPP